MKFSPPTIIHILIQCKLMLGYSFFSVIVGIIFQHFLRKNLKNPLEIQNKSSFEPKISNICENYSTKPSQSAPDTPNDNVNVEPWNHSVLLCRDVVQSKFFCPVVVCNASLSREIVQCKLAVVCSPRHRVSSVI